MRKCNLYFLPTVLLVVATIIPYSESFIDYNASFIRQSNANPLDSIYTTFDSGVMILSCNDEAEKHPLDDFPEIFTEEELRQGWIVLHIIAAIYFFTLLAIVCNDYFLPTVECICEDLNLSKDIAAATFMATATTMPEFFTNTISTLLLESDMGFGTVIGSLMFNTLGVAGVASLAINKPIQLDWWPIARDCFIYTINTIILIVLAWGNRITFNESCAMMAFLVIYYILTFNNNKFMPAIRVFMEDKMNCCFSTRYDFTEPPENSAKAKLPLKKDPLDGDGVFVISFPENTSTMSSTANLTQSKSLTENNEKSSKSADTLFSMPSGESTFWKFWWIYTFPLKFILRCIIPNPITNRKFYPLTFVMCIIVIGMNAYMIVWMLTALGVAIRVPSIIMGLTFLAAGSTTPEAVSSVISLRSGENGIGVSNSLGANSLAILLSLGVPWFIRNCMIYNNEVNYVKIVTQGIQYNIFILMFCTMTLFIVLSLSGYRLTKRAGIGLLTVYLVLIVLQILIEMNVFFPERC